MQKSRMVQIQGVEGEAVVVYREPETTKEMCYPRLSQRVKNMTIFSYPWNSHKVDSCNELKKGRIPCDSFFSLIFGMFFMQRKGKAGCRIKSAMTGFVYLSAGLKIMGKLD